MPPFPSLGMGNRIDRAQAGEIRTWNRRSGTIDGPISDGSGYLEMASPVLLTVKPHKGAFWETGLAGPLWYRLPRIESGAHS
jgi:hypothetical protein